MNWFTDLKKDLEANKKALEKRIEEAERSKKTSVDVVRISEDALKYLNEIQKRQEDAGKT